MSTTTDPVELVMTMVSAMSAAEKKRVIEALACELGTVLVTPVPLEAGAVFSTPTPKPAPSAGKTRRVWLRTVTSINAGKKGIEALEGEWCGEDLSKVGAGTLVLLGERWPTKTWHLVRRVYGSDEVEVGGVKMRGVEVLLRGATDFGRVMDAVRANGEERF